MSTHLRESLRFGDVTIEYDDRVLRPRPWTELQSRWAAELLEVAAPGPVLELCCGAGHIGLQAVLGSRRHLVAVDLNPQACYFTRLNAEGAGMAHRVEVREGRLEAVIRQDEVFSLVVADPPWVRSTDIDRFPEDPRLAIDGGDDGLAVARACLTASAGHVVAGGSILLQLGDPDQADALARRAGRDGWDRGELRAGPGGVVLQLVARTEQS
jgi:release factor glutamine methyltransferase